MARAGHGATPTRGVACAGCGRAESGVRGSVADRDGAAAACDGGSFCASSDSGV